MKMLLCALFGGACLITGCKHMTPRENIKTGASIGAAACEWIEEVTDAGAILAICATLEEIAKYGKHPVPIMRSRGYQVPAFANDD